MSLNRIQELMQNKVWPFLFIFLFVGMLFLFGLNNFEVPVLFWGQETKVVKGTVTEVIPVRRGRGNYEKVTYLFDANDATFVGSFIGGNRQGAQLVGNHLSIEYLVSNPQKSKVIGFYRIVDKNLWR